MARKKKSSPADDLIGLVSKLPWWAGFAMATISYFVLHQMAAAASVPLKPGETGALFKTMFKSAAYALQYILPILFLAGAGLSAWKRRERQALVEHVVASKSADALDGMTWHQFEKLVGEAFRLQGYTVTETGGGGADGGVDLALTRGTEKFLVQCKQWRAFKVGVGVVRELYGVMAASGAAGGFVVTSGRFTEEATSFASGRNVKLVDGPQLHALIKQAQAARGDRGAQPPSTSSRATAATPSSSRASTPEAPGARSSTVGSATSAHTCPLCSKVMVKRTARRGANAGGEFWGCTGYPECKGTKQMA